MRCERIVLRRARRRPRAAAGGDRRHGRHRGAAPRAHARGARRRAPPRREGDRAAEPARLVELPLLPPLRPGLGVPRLRRHARAPPRRRARWRATTAATASPCRRPAPDCGSVSVARHGAGTEQLERELEELVRAAAGVPARLGRRGGGRDRHRAAPLRRGRAPACWSARRWSPRGTTSPTSRSAWCSTPTPRCASPTSAPRSARSRSWRSSPAAAAAAQRGGRVIVQALDPDARALRHAARARRRRLPGRRAAAARGVRLPALRPPDPGGVLGDRRRDRSRRRPRRSARWWRTPACRCSGRRRCSAARAASARSSWCARASGSPRSRRCARRWRPWRPTARHAGGRVRRGRRSAVAARPAEQR